MAKGLRYGVDGRLLLRWRSVSLVMEIVNLRNWLWEKAQSGNYVATRNAEE
jgi:hypothetical protein